VFPRPAAGVDDEVGFFRVVRAGFSAARKQIINSLSHGLDLPKAQVLDLLARAGITPERRAETLAVEVMDRTGAAKRADVPVTMRPLVIATSDDSWLFNNLVLALRARLALAGEGGGRGAAVRLNLAVVLMRVGNWAEALAELSRMRLPPGPGVSNGTVQYLTGLCHEAMDQPAEAENAWRAAAADAGSLLTEDGPPVKELAERKLAGRRVP